VIFNYRYGLEAFTTRGAILAETLTVEGLRSGLDGEARSGRTTAVYKP